MSKPRKEVDGNNEQIIFNNKKYVSYQEGTKLYSLGLTLIQKHAKEANAVIKVGGRALINVQKFDAYLASLEKDEE